MIRNRKARLAIGTFLGGCAGLSLTTSVLPTALSALGISDPFSIRFALSGYAAHTALLWAAGGWAAVRIDNSLFAALIMALVGVASGLLLCFTGLSSEAKILLSTTAVCALYAATGGLLIGNVLRSPEEFPDDEA